MTKEEILKAEWVVLGRWVQPTLSGCFWTHWHESANAQKILPDYTPSQLVFLDGHTLVLKKDQEVVNRIIAESYKQGTLSDLCDRFVRMGQEDEKRHLHLLERSDLSLGEYVAELIDSYREIVGIWTMAILIAIEAEGLAKSRKLIASDDELLRKMRRFMRTTWLEEQMQDISRITAVAAEKGIDDKEIQESINAHLKKFAWFGTHHWNGEGYDREKLIADIQGALKKSVPVSSVGSILSSLDENDSLWRIIALCTYWRTHCAEVTSRVVFLSRDKMTDLARKWGMTYEEFTYLSAPVIIKIIHSGVDRPTLPANYDERRTAYGCYLNDGVEQVVTGEKLQEMIRTLVKTESVGSVSEFKGVIASKGAPEQGRARIILSPRDFGRFQTGDILVVPEPTPDFVPLMKIAAAIVTEVGGITSHAAIVSRELKKPCIIGTKIATQVLKDGDMVEVDADSGIVRIIKRA